MKPNLSSELLDKAQEAAKQYQRAELFWNCSSMTDEEIQQHRQRFFDSYSEALDAVIAALFPKNAQKQDLEQSKKYLEKQGIASVINLYRTQKEDEKEQKKGKELFQEAPAKKEKESDSMEDSSLTDDQRKGLHAFHQWLYRNCDRQGMKYFGKTLFGADGSARNFVERFMSQPPKVQLRALYLLETKQRKNPDVDDVRKMEEERKYAPKLDPLKKTMTANKFKFWKRTNGSYLYWHKLNEALEAAEELGDVKEDVKEAQVKANGAEVNVQGAQKQANGTDVEAKNAEKNGEEEPKTQAEIADEKAEAFINRSEKVAEAPGVWSDTNYAKELLEEIGTNSETAIEHILSGWKADPNAEEPEGYITRLVEKLGGEVAAKYYGGSTSIGLAALTAFSGVASLFSEGRELHSIRHVQGTLSRVGDALDLTSNGLYAAESTSSIVGSVAGFMEKAKTVAEIAGTVGTGLVGAANLMLAAKGGVDIFSARKGKQHAQRAEELAEKTGDEKMKNRAAFAKFLNAKKSNRGVRSFIQGSTGAIAAGFSLFASAIPVAGQVAGIVSLSMALYDGYVKKNRDLQEKYRKGIDSELFNNGKDLETADQALVETYRKRMEKLDAKSESYKKLDELCQDKNKEKRLNILRKEKAVQEKCVFLRDCYEKTVNGIGEEAYRNVFYIDPKKGGTFENLITAENYHKYFTEEKIEENDNVEDRARKEEHNKQVAVRMSYKELMESFGAKAEFLSEKEERAKLNKKNKNLTQEQFQRELESKAESRKNKVARTFERM